jgi:hypothetical protein
MSNEIATNESAYDVLSELKGRQAKYATPSAAEQITKVGDWVPYIQVMQSTSNECKESGFPIGHFALCKNRQKTDIGKSLVAMIISWRPKAMQYSPDVVSFYDPNSEAFKKIEIESMVPNSSKGYGPELLLWLPDVDGGLFVTLFLGNPTGRVEAPNFLAAYNKGQLTCRVSAELIKDKKQNRSWHGCRYSLYEIPITNMPQRDRLNKVLEAFNNPKESEREPAEAAESADSGRG